MTEYIVTGTLVMPGDREKRQSGRVYKEGSTVDLTDEQAERLVGYGVVKSKADVEKDKKAAEENEDEFVHDSNTNVDGGNADDKVKDFKQEEPPPDKPVRGRRSV